MSPPRKKPDVVLEHEAESHKITDPTEMRALAHPVRLALLEILAREETLTATEAGELLGESPSNCSFHLRTLEKYGYVEEAEGGSGRSRPWRRKVMGFRLERVNDDPAADLPAQGLANLHVERTFQGLQQWIANQAAFPAEWNKAAFASTTVEYLTVEELQEMEEDILAVLLRFKERTRDRTKRPEGAMPVAMAAFAHPLPPTPRGN